MLIKFEDMHNYRHLVRLSGEGDKMYLHRYVPKDDITDDEKEWLRNWDEGYFYSFGYHVIVNYEDIK